MRVVAAIGGEVEVVRRPEPTPGDREILVKVHAAGINNTDISRLNGQRQSSAAPQEEMLGVEFAGEVMATGPGVSRFEPGDRVMGLVAGGGQAEWVVTHESLAMRIPEEVGWAQAGGFVEAFVTAFDALFEQAALSAGERVLIHGAAGGVGTAAVQLARAARADVTATVRTPALRSRVEQLGASTVVDAADFGQHGPFDVVLELVGATNMAANLSCLSTKGRICVIGVAGGGSEANIDLRELMYRRGRILASTLRWRPLTEKAAAVNSFEGRVLPLLSSGSITVPISARYPWEAAPEAYRAFTAGGKFGKLVFYSAASRSKEPPWKSAALSSRLS